MRRRRWCRRWGRSRCRRWCWGWNSLNDQRDVISISALVGERRGEVGIAEEVRENKSFRLSSEGSGYRIGEVVGEEGEVFASHRDVGAAHSNVRIAQRHRAVHDEVVVIGRGVGAVDLDRNGVVAIEDKVSIDRHLARAGPGGESESLARRVDVSGVGARQDVDRARSARQSAVGTNRFLPESGPSPRIACRPCGPISDEKSPWKPAVALVSVPCSGMACSRSRCR